ncbi:hypothetical protein AM231_22495 [Paenibacillus solani]|uniref:Uncharacterized protein n=1 Tax=Paenibacillus solani TaxID=1705565 RepID=A0A0M1N3I4_9BACL|nr:hypothetical protein AM231_22495 [Paenibacillus solani]
MFLSNVVGLDVLIVMLLLLIVNYLIIYLIVSEGIKNSGLKSDIITLRNEVETLKKLLDEGSSKSP